ncbi:MAG TPA: hypothetical protein VHZ56_01000, partial [Devosia sp.]|nr:hypothetical protein [Devosia sp.]
MTAISSLRFPTPGVEPGSERMLPPTVIMLVFAMVVIAVGGFAYISDQEQSLSALRLQTDALGAATTALERTDADAARALNGAGGGIAGFFHDLEVLKTERPTTLDGLGNSGAALDKLEKDWGEAIALGADGHLDEGRALIDQRQTDMAVDGIDDQVSTALAAADLQMGQHEDRIRLGTLVVLLLQVLSGTLAIAAMFFAFRSTAREALGRSAALQSADTSREQVARLFEMADVLQSAADYGDANQVLKATA